MSDTYISFPYLGLNFKIDRVAFSVGNKEIYWYGIIIAFGFLLAVIVAMKLAKKSGLKKDTILDVVLYSAPVAIVGARLYYVIFRWEYYGSHPHEIIEIWNGGLAIYGAIISAVVVTVIYCCVKKENIGSVCDVGAVGLAIGQCVGRWGNFVNQEAFGTNTTLPWAMTGNEIKEELTRLMLSGVQVNPDLPVHPTFLYESLWNFVLVLVLCFLFQKKKFNGQIFLGYISFYGLGRFWIEGLRTDSLTTGGFRISQVIAIVCFVVGAVFYVYKLVCAKKYNLHIGNVQESQESNQ